LWHAKLAPNPDSLAVKRNFRVKGNLKNGPGNWGEAYSLFCAGVFGFSFGNDLLVLCQYRFSIILRVSASSGKAISRSPHSLCVLLGNEIKDQWNL
jgi:hypothetical protein